MIRRTFISGRPKRRHSTPTRAGGSASGAGAGFTDLDNPRIPFSGEVNFLPLRQVLDGRVKRRIRRNGLSEEMNTITAEKRQRAKETKAELARLQAEVAEKDEEIRRLHDETIVVDTERVWELEKEVESLRRELASRSSPPVSSSPSYNWTMAARDPFSDDFMELDTGNEVEDGNFGEITMADLACSTPTRKARASFPTPPTTSPAAMLMTPCSHLSTPQSHTGVQASFPDPEKQQLEDELASLQLEICKLTSTLESYATLTSRLSDKLIPFASEPSGPEDASSSPRPDIEAHLNNLLRALSDRSAALLELNSSLSNLGFPGSDSSEIVTSLSSAFRTARLELEYLTPGEISLPLTTAGAAVLDLVLDRLRDLSRRAREADDSIDEYHALELSLRQQLGARVDAMDGMARETSRLELSLADRDARIADLELGLSRLRGAAASYTRDIKELEQLVQSMETELETATAERDSNGAACEKLGTDLEAKAAAVADLEAKLEEAARRTVDMQAEIETLRAAHAGALANVQSKHGAELQALNGAHGKALALRDARVAELREEVARVSEALRTAHESIQLLRVEGGHLRAENEDLEAAMADDKLRAKGAIESMRAELERVVRMSEGLLKTPKKARGSWGKATGAEDTRRDSALGEEGEEEEVSLLRLPISAKVAHASASSMAEKGERAGKGKKRRYDSGLGFLDEEEINVDE